MKIRNLLVLLLAGSFLTACAAAEDDAATEEAALEASAMSEDEAAVTALADYYAEHFNMGHASMVAELYADSAVTLFANVGVNLGRAEIEAALVANLEAGSGNLAINREAVHVGEGVAVARGTWSVDVPTGEGESMTQGGGYMTVFVKYGEDWKIQAVLSQYDSEVGSEALMGELSPNVDDVEGEGMIALVTAYEEAWAAGDTEALSMLWTEDAHAAFNQSPAMEGRAAIAEYLAANVAGTIDIHPKATIPLGDGYAAHGGWYEVTTDEGHASGNYLSLMRAADDGSYQLHWGASNGRPTLAD